MLIDGLPKAFLLDLGRENGVKLKNRDVLEKHSAITGWSAMRRVFAVDPAGRARINVPNPGARAKVATLMISGNRVKLEQRWRHQIASPGVAGSRDSLALPRTTLTPVTIQISTSTAVKPRNPEVLRCSS